MRGRRVDFMDRFDSFHAMKPDQASLCRKMQVQVPFVNCGIRNAGGEGRPSTGTVGTQGWMY